MLLKGKIAIVTGGTRGIGAAIVRKFVKEGASVAFTFIRHNGLARRIEKQAKGRAKGFEVDIKDFAKMKKFISEVKQKYGRIDILVNNAGILKDKSLMLMDEDDWKEVIDTNLTGAFNATRASIVTFMKQKNGNIINMASLSGLVGKSGQTNYVASKAGLIGFTKSLAKEVGPFNIRVNAIAPGFIKTLMTANLNDKEAILKEIPLRRFGTADEVAGLALFLAGDGSSYITGQTLVIDGGII